MNKELLRELISQRFGEDVTITTFEKKDDRLPLLDDDDYSWRDHLLQNFELRLKISKKRQINSDYFSEIRSFMKIFIVNSIAFLIALLGVSLVANGGIWESNSTKVFRLDVSSIKSYKITEADEFWIQSLLKNLVKKGGRVAKHHVFIRTNGIFRVSDRKNTGIVYVNRNNSDEFITSDPVFLVDFKKGKVDMLVFGAQSLHPGPDQRFIVLVDTAGENLGGIPVLSGGVKPKFSGRVVTWY